MSVLTRREIWNRMRQPDDKRDPLVITPLLEESQIGASSVDLRLGHQFIILRKSAVTHVDPTNREEALKEILRSQQRSRVSLHQQFIIHPGQLVLGATLEYVSIPRNVAATVEGRSSWGRLGLIIATASSVAPGFKGCITLELVNDGEAPLALYPGVRIAQMVLHATNRSASYREEPRLEDDEGADTRNVNQPKYDCPIGPQFSKIHEDREMEFWGKKK